MADAHKNFAYSTVATAPSPASSGTSLVVAAGEGAKFPAVPFNATVWPVGAQPSTTNAEIVRVTNISTDTLTITRAQESTAARSIVVGDQIAATITAKTLTDVEAMASATIKWVTFDGTSAANLACTYSRTGTTVTVSSTAHGHLVGHVVFIDFTSGGALDGQYTIVTVPDANSYTVTTVASGAIAGGSTMNELRRTIADSDGVHSVSFVNTSTFYVNFSAAFPSADYATPMPQCSTGATGGFIWAGTETPLPSTTSCSLLSRNVSLVATAFTKNCAVFIG
jgi:hypothetical protein